MEELRDDHVRGDRMLVHVELPVGGLDDADKMMNIPLVKLGEKIDLVFPLTSGFERKIK